MLLIPASILAPAPSSSTQDKQDPQDKTAPFPREGEYADLQTCFDCHEDEYDALSAGFHAPVVENENLQKCETCHGPGMAHANDMDNAPELITQPHLASQEIQQTKLCSTCHVDQIRDHRGDLAGFVALGKKCTTCHKVHQKKKAPPVPSLNFKSKAAMARIRPITAAVCVTCHKLRDTILAKSTHHSMSSKADAKGCETCHGPGSQHQRNAGLSRLITRPDLATDGVATCRSCHEKVDPVEWHWKGKEAPILLTPDMTCTTCHTIHVEAKLPGPVRQPLWGRKSP